MAHGSILTDTLSGRIGNVVFMTKNGKQIIRRYVKQADAQTIGQLKQRCQFRSASLAYRIFSKFVKGSLSVKSDKARGEFIKYNTKLAPFITKDEYELRRTNGCAKIAPYVVSNGSLTNFWNDIAQIVPSCNRNSQQNIGLTCVLQFNPTMRQRILAEFESVGNYTGTLGDIVMRIAADLGYNGSHLGLFLATGPASDNFGYYYNDYTYVELCRGSQFDIPVTAQYMSQEHSWQLNIDGTPVPVEESTLTATCTNSDITICLGPTREISASSHPSAACMLAVEKLDKLRVSSSQLIMMDWMQNPYSAYFQSAYADYASRSYAPSREPEQAQLLNNGNR